MNAPPFRNAGFTLIELLVVIGLLGLIIAAVLVGMNGAKRKAYDTTAQACSHDIRTAQERARTADQTFRPYAALGTLRACQAITPEGNANADHFLYAVKHPKGNVTFTVTDTDTYRDGTARSGAVLTNDPAQLVLGAGGTGGTGGTGGAAPGTSIADCQNTLGVMGGYYFEGPLAGPFSVHGVDATSTVRLNQITSMPGGYTTRILNPDVGGMTVTAMNPATGLFMQWQGTYAGTFTDTTGTVNGTPEDIIAAYHAQQGSAMLTPAEINPLIHSMNNWNGQDSGRCTPISF